MLYLRSQLTMSILLKGPFETRLVRVEALFYRTKILWQHNFRPKEFVLAYEARVDGPNVSTARVVNQALLHHGELAVEQRHSMLDP